MSSSPSTLQNVASVDDFLKVAATETVPLFEYLELEFLLDRVVRKYLHLMGKGTSRYSVPQPLGVLFGSALSASVDRGLTGA